MVRQVAYSLGESDAPAAAETLAAIAATNDAVYVRGAVLSSIDTSNVLQVMKAYLKAMKDRRDDFTSRLVELAVRQGDAHTVAEVFRSVATGSESNLATKFGDLADLFDAADRRSTDLLESVDGAVLTSIRKLHEEARRSLADGGQSEDVQKQALRLLGRRRDGGTKRLLARRSGKASTDTS